MGIHDVNATTLILSAAEELKKISDIKPLAWAPFAKTGVSRERSPIQLDWWYIRAAAIMRKLFIIGSIGTEKLRVKFGGRKNRGVKPDRFMPCGGNHLRKILQQLEKAGFAKQVQKGAHKGRVLTPKGQSFLDGIAARLMKEQGIVFAEKPKVDLKVEVTEEKAEKPKKPRAPRKPRAKKTDKSELKVENKVEKEEAPVAEENAE